jgi:hypothetical protein
VHLCARLDASVFTIEPREDRAGVLTNLARMNKLLALMALDLRGETDSRAWADQLRQRTTSPTATPPRSAPTTTPKASPRSLPKSRRRPSPSESIGTSIRINRPRPRFHDSVGPSNAEACCKPKPPRVSCRV